MLKLKHINALNRFALLYGYGWRRRLLASLVDGEAMPARTSEHDAGLLRELFATAGTSLIEKFKPREGGYGKVAYLRKDHMERFNTLRAWVVNAWRLVDANGRDIIQPWSHTRTEARKTASANSIFLIEDI